MKRQIIILSLLIQILTLNAQTYTLADNATSNIILRKHLKAKFLLGCYGITGKANPDSILNDLKEFGYGDFFIRQTTYAFGDWALQPDFEVYKLNIKSPWVDYEIYKLKIPEYSSRNDSIAGYYAFRDKNYGDPSNPLQGENLIAFNKETGMMIYLDWPNNVLFHRSKSFLFNNKYPTLKWVTLPDFSKKVIPLLSPTSEEERKKMLLSELMKNIYSYRLIKSGILDSLNEGETNILKEKIEQFPLIDDLIPDYDENL